MKDKSYTMKYFVTILLSMAVCTVQAQKAFITRNAKITFVAPKDDDVKATNNEVTSRLTDNGQLMFSLLIKSFRFEYAEMQEHFNNKYLESNKFPRADFKGVVLNIKDVNFTKNGKYKATVKGSLTMHGVTKELNTIGTIEVTNGKPTAVASFIIVLKDFNIDAASVTDKASITVTAQYQ